LDADGVRGMSKHARWLATEIERWVGGNLITAEQAARLRALYSVAEAPVAWGLIVFFGIGAVIIGLGVILMFAYNWDAIPKAGKLALVLGATAGAHAFGLALRVKPDWRAWLGEGLALLGTMLFGAGIWLIAQIYHIDEHYPNGFLYWGLGALAMAWALPSAGQAIIAAVSLTIWTCSEIVGFNTTVDIASLILVLGIGPLVWRLQSAILMAVTLVALYVVLLFNAGEWGSGGAVFLTALSLSTLLIAGGRLVANLVPERALVVMRFFGFTGALLCAYIAGFHDVADDVLRDVSRHGGGMPGLSLYRWGVTILAVTAWAWTAARPAVRRLVALEEWLFPAALLFCQAVVLTGQGGEEVLVALVFNLLVLFVGAMWAVRGCREGRLRPTVLGSLLIAALVFARYFDLFDSLAARGLVFVGFGAALFAEGFYYRRLRLADAAGRTTP
jgi:Predicted membrane protein (DUF2157)